MKIHDDENDFIEIRNVSNIDPRRSLEDFKTNRLTQMTTNIDSRYLMNEMEKSVS